MRNGGSLAIQFVINMVNVSIEYVLSLDRIRKGDSPVHCAATGAPVPV
jgi:hypothetical protein